MEGNMVVSLNPQDCISVVKQYFFLHFKDFELIKETFYNGYWWMQYKNKENSFVCFDGDIGGHFQVKIIIGETEYSLWQYNRSVNNATQSTKENILFQLNILKSFLT